MKAHLLIFDPSQITRDKVTKKIDQMSVVVNWNAFFDNTICMASEEDARSLSQLLRIEFPELRFLISEVDPLSKGGWLPKPIWDFLNNPAPVDQSADA